MRCMTAIWPAGPPKLSAATRAQVRAAAGEALPVVPGRGADAGDQGPDALGLGAGELAVLEVDVVHDLGDRAQRRLAEAQAREQHLEGAAVALVGELGLVHV